MHTMFQSMNLKFENKLNIVYEKLQKYVTYRCDDGEYDRGARHRTTHNPQLV